MGQLKAKTLIEKHGFSDKEKGTPEHDKIQKWVYKNAHKIIDELFVKDSEEFEIISNQWEFEIIQNTTYNKSIIGFVDLRVQYFRKSDNREYHAQTVFFEIKTSIPSIGELIRQLNFYKTYLGNYRFVVVSADDSCADILTEQGYYFYKYDDPTKLF